MPNGYYRSNAAKDNQHNAEGAVPVTDVHAGPDNKYESWEGKNPEPGGLTDVPFDSVAPDRYGEDSYTAGSLRPRKDAHRHT